MRKAKKISQKELATALNVAISTISRVESDSAMPENTVRVAEALGLNFSSDLIIKNDIDFFIIPEPLTQFDLDLSLPQHLISNFKCNVYIVQSTIGLSQKILRAFFNNSWIFLIIQIDNKFYVFHRNSHTSVIYSLNDFEIFFVNNADIKSKFRFVDFNSAKIIKSIYNHDLSADELQNCLKQNIVGKFIIDPED